MNRRLRGRVGIFPLSGKVEFDIHAPMRVFVLYLCCMWLMSCCYGQAKGEPSAPDSCGAAVCVMEWESRQMLVGIREHEERQVASLQQLVAALCLCDAGELDKIVTIEPTDCRVPPFRLQLRRGARYSRRELMLLMLMRGGNDAAHALARDSAGNESAFVERMNAKAREIGMLHTCFVNVSGLPAPQYSTAYDMALAACEAYGYELIRTMCATRQHEYDPGTGGVKRVYHSNQLMHTYPWVRGMKYGYCHSAGHCLIACGESKGRVVIVVVLGGSRPGIWEESLRYLNAA